MLASTPAFAEDCKLTHTDNHGKTLKFDLTRSVKGVGSIVSEKGHYSTNLTTTSFGPPQQYWFQMCDLMSFSKQDQKAADSPASLCQRTYSGQSESVCGYKPPSSSTPSCQADEADMKTCGTTCAALQHSSSQCFTIGQNFSTDLIANKHPELGVVVTLRVHALLTVGLDRHVHKVRRFGVFSQGPFSKLKRDKCQVKSFIHQAHRRRSSFKWGRRRS